MGVDALVNPKVDGATTTSLYTVQFTHSSNSGKQNTLECEVVADSTVDGAQPKYNGVDACAVYNVGGPEWFDESGTQQTLSLTTAFPEVTIAQTKALILPGGIYEGNNVRGLPAVFFQG